MAGRFLSIDEAAQKLGLSADEVHRLVDRRELYPIRDGASLKFKADDLDTYLATRDEGPGTRDDLALDPDEGGAAPANSPSVEPAPLELELDDAAAIEDSLTLDVEAVFSPDIPGAGPASGIAAPASAVGADSLVISDAVPDAASSVVELADDRPSFDAVSAISGLAIDAGASAASGVDIALDGDSGRLSFDRDDLEVESIIGASAPSLPAGDAAADAGTLEIDLGPALSGNPVDVSGSLVVGGADDLVVGAHASAGKVGSALSEVLDSGVLIEEKAVKMEGVVTWDEVDLGIEDDEPAQKDAEQAEDIDASEDGFNLGGDSLETDNEPSASVDVGEEPSDDSGFFSSGGDSSGFAADRSFATGSGSIEFPGEFVADTPFSGWQIGGLVCCSLILLTGALVAFDLVRTIGSPKGTVLSNHLLDSLATIFGWR